MEVRVGAATKNEKKGAGKKRNQGNLGFWPSPCAKVEKKWMEGREMGQEKI